MDKHERWNSENPELARLEELEELGGARQLTPDEEEELNELYRWRDEH